MNILKSRRDKLSEKITTELKTNNPSLENILTYVDSYEKDNLDTIDKCKREKLITTKKINGAQEGCINSHGPITKILIGSATKRIHGALLANHSTQSENKYVRFFKKIFRIN